MGMTPILGIPFDLPVTSAADSSERFQRQQAKIALQCDKQLDEDLARCEELAPTGAKSGYELPPSYKICTHQAYERYSECIAGKGTHAIRSPLFTLGKGH